MRYAQREDEIFKKDDRCIQILHDHNLNFTYTPFRARFISLSSQAISIRVDRTIIDMINW